DLAFVLKRAKISSKRSARDYFDNDHSDVYLVSRCGGSPRNLTHGISDDSGYWNPVWSPDGGRIAMLSTKGGDNVRLYVWERKTGSLKRLAECGVDLLARTGGDSRQPFIWLSATQLVCAMMPEGQRHHLSNPGGRMQVAATREWSRAETGTEVTAS